ncbi:CD48 antigen-like isoform X2 [Fundulus heteroclitus]|uniref:CD48 antigen-like isoform X2 n=1 Tax=Fundulus heteroclitus TaxID=8078 RepID=UPI00165B327F|nr:CD48 antigen-like isoform X2 [Fundulus heteroclitus]
MFCLSSVMKTTTRIYFLYIAMMRFSAAEELKRNLNGVVGGNVTFPDPLLELGFLLEGITNLAMVNEGKLQILEEKYKNKLHWNRNSGLFTITDLQKSDSGDYNIDSKGGRALSVSYSLTVYDGAPTPAVETLTVSSDSCWLLCSVDKATSLLWYKDQEVQNQNSSASSLPITVHKEDRDSSYRCVAANPAENKTLHVNVRTACGFNETESGGNQRAYFIGVGVSVLLVVFVAGIFWMIKQRILGKKQPVRQTQGGRIDRAGPEPSPSCMTAVRYNCQTDAAAH